MRCDDPRSDYSGNTTGSAGPFQLGSNPRLRSVDLVGAALAVEDDTLAVTVELAEPLPGLSPDERRRVGVQLGLTEETAEGVNNYTVEFEWPKMTAGLGTDETVTPEPLAEADLDSTTGMARIPLRDLPELDEQFDWAALSFVSYSDLSPGGSGTVVAFDSCPGEDLVPSDRSKTLTFGGPDQKMDNDLAVESTTTTSAAEETSTDQIVGLTGKGNTGGSPASDPGPDCEGVSGCQYSNGIDFSSLRESIESAIEAKTGERLEADCDRGNDQPPQLFRVGETLTCLVDVGPFSIAIIDAEVLEGGGWQWTIKSIKGD